jgi:putative autoinducer-2 (AI-2) aldolase
VVAELGAHFVKTYYCDDFERVVEGCPVPIVIAGGPKLETERDALDLAYRALQEGAAGVDMGRNVWQSAAPAPVLRALRAIVHERATAAQAHELFLELKAARQSQPV